MPFPLGDFPFAEEIKLLEAWFNENWPQSKDALYNPRIMFKLRERASNQDWDSVLSWGNGEISREKRLLVPRKLVDDEKAYALTKASFLSDLRGLITSDMNRWGPAKQPKPELEKLGAQK